MIPLRLPALVLSSSLLYLLCVPGFGLLVHAQQGFELGFRASVRQATPSNALRSDRHAQAELGEQRLERILRAWSTAIAMVRVARLAALGIGALVLLDRLASRVHASAAPLPPSS